MLKVICYCFSYTKQDIVDDVKSNGGHSTIMSRIAAEKKAGQCRCKEKNPSGR